MRRTSFSILFAIVAGVVLASPALARDGDEGPFGLGISAGEPTGISAKYFFSEDAAIDATVGWSFIDESALHLHFDMLWHFDDQPGEDDSPWAALFGFGFRYKFGEEEELAGVRVPFGTTYAFGESQFEGFLEIVPVINFGTGEDFTANAAVGVHYFFD
jgi:hypothetical protein